jgi:hypothetical protein
VAGFWSESTVCGLAMLSVYGVIEMTVLSYAGTPAIRACAQLAAPRGRSPVRGEFRARHVRRTAVRRAVLVA